ncbi:hypothetical protein [Cardinium endosymbiont of Tipula unca]|uniref:hypothetical protein n=1 Tax=Cardinium endosymbiont of Tipula unca TaxID=3066216 RepID=UPI0030CD8B7E
MLIFSIRLLVKIVVLATCTKACFLSQKVYYLIMHYTHCNFLRTVNLFTENKDNRPSAKESMP